MTDTNTARLKFLCRRGMKELDEILNPFFDAHFSTLDPLLQKNFADLLNQEEPTLFDWLVLGIKPENQELKEIIELIIIQKGRHPERSEGSPSV